MAISVEPVCVVTLAWRLSISAATALLAPALVSAQDAIHKFTRVRLPAWVPLGDERPRGLDAMGQRFILFGGVLVSLVVMILPGAAAGGIVVIAVRRFIGAAALIPAAALCGAIVLIEVLMAVEAIAPAYERMDLVSTNDYRLTTMAFSPLAGLWSEYRGTERPSRTSVVL